MRELRQRGFCFFFQRKTDAIRRLCSPLSFDFCIVYSRRFIVTPNSHFSLSLFYYSLLYTLLAVIFFTHVPLILSSGCINIIHFETVSIACIYLCKKKKITVSGYIVYTLFECDFVSISIDKPQKPQSRRSKSHFILAE